MTTVLIVDDLASERQMIGSVMLEAGFEIIKASDGCEAVKLSEEKKLDLVVLDIVMPKMNGFEVVRELRSNPKTEKVPVILCSQKNTEIDRVWGMEQGADAYLIKPFEAKQLIDIAQRLLENN
ncbi:MAG: response regulator [Cyanobacteriota bacterium]|nr:response regulator [Cyanobacteriota bacterium]